MTTIYNSNPLASVSTTGYREGEPTLKQPQVKEWLDNEEHALTTLQDQVTLLAERLGGVLMPSCPYGQEIGKEEHLVPIASVLKQNVMKIQNIQHDIQDMIQRLEV